MVNEMEENSSENKEAQAEATKPAVEKAAAPKKEEANGLIGFNDFLKVKLRVGQIIEAEKIEKSEKLIKLQVDLGEENKRQIIAGIAKYYEAENLVGRKIAVVANLKPAKLMGELSEGMLLAASDDSGNLELVSVGASLPAGASIG